MKKLINLLETNVTVSSLGLSNTTTDTDTSNDLISPTLLNDINTAAKNANVNVKITTAVSGHRETTTSGNPSRHIPGNAVDIAMINGKSVSNANRADADALVSQLKNMGYDSSGNESGHPKEVLWQVPEHYDHVHVSNTTDTPSTSTTTLLPSSTGTTNSDLESRIDATVKGNLTGMVSGIGKVLNAATGINVTNESKIKRISEQINRIKGLM